MIDNQTTDKILSSFNSDQLEIIRILLELKPKNANLFIVGGAIRDAILGFEVNDIDIVIENGSANKLANLFYVKTGIKTSKSPGFDNASFDFLDSRFDLITARDEKYDKPAGKPVYWPALIEKDLARRDFSINSIALALKMDCCYELIDLFDGFLDLKTRTLRFLHQNSFVDDPSRIVRGARLATRLDFELENQTFESINPSLEKSRQYLRENKRILSELDLIFTENYPGKAFEKLEKWNALTRLYQRLDIKPLLMLDEMRKNGEVIDKSSYQMAFLANSSLSLENRWQKSLFSSLKKIKNVDQNNYWLLSESEQMTFFTLNPVLAKKLKALDPPHFLRGADVLALGLAPGERVGFVLTEVERARKDGIVKNFAEEMNLAKDIIQKLINGDK